MSSTPAMPQKRMSLTAQKAMDFYVDVSQQLIDSEQNTLVKVERLSAQAALVHRGWPTRRDEAWQYTPINSFLQHEFSPKGVSELELAKLQAYLPEHDVIRLVFVDGHFDDSLSDSLGDLPKGLMIETTADVIALADQPRQLEMHTDKMAHEPFALLNTMLYQDGINIEVEAGAMIELPVHLVHVQTVANHASVLRHRVVLQKNSALTLVEHTFSLHEEMVQMTNHLTELVVGENANLKQIVVQDLNLQSFYFGHQWIEQAAKSVFETLYLGLGGQVARHQNALDMVGEHGFSQQNSVCFVQKSQIQDSRTDTQHLVPHCQSQQLHKYVLKDKARGVFNGMIKVAKDAQKTDGQMDNKNLVLSNEAKMDTKPQLEIYADDVKCSHGSATGQLDEDQVFYLQARGIRKPQAIQLITEAFLLEPLEVVSNPNLANWLRALVQQRINHLA